MKCCTKKTLVGFSIVATGVIAAGLGGCSPAQDVLTDLSASDEPAGLNVKHLPIIESIIPETVIADGGSTVTIRGRYFTNDTTITFGDHMARSVEFVDGETLRSVTPPLSPGTVDVVASNGQGSGLNSRAQVTVRLGVSPPNGPVTGGTTITIFNPEGRNNIAADDQMVFAVLRPAVDPMEPNFDFEKDVVQVDVAQGTTYINNSLMTAVTPPHAEGDTAVFIASSQGTVFYVGMFRYELAVPLDGGPRLVSAISTSNTTVLVTFSEAVQGTLPGGNGGPSGALDLRNYAIAQENENPESGVLFVADAAFSGPDNMGVVLTTVSQSEVMYELTVTGIKDLAGNILASPELLVNPATTLFVGTPLTCVYGRCSNANQICSTDVECGAGNTCQSFDSSTKAQACTDSGTTCTANVDCPNGLCLTVCDGVDADGDGLSDSSEQRGWQVTVQLINGDIVTRTVTSNPFVSDSDGDGVSDRDEKSFGLDPRSSDTDADQLSDYDELNLWFSDPSDQDTDDDTFSDWLDAIFFKTSPILADSDGDQLSDSEEILERNRNPLVADLPVPQITVDGISLELDVRSTYTDDENVTREHQDTRSTSFTQSRTESLGRSDTRTTQAENQFSQKAGAEYGTSGGKAYVEVGFLQSRARGFSSTVDTQEAETSQSEYQQSVSEALSVSEGHSVTREIQSASVKTMVNIANQSDIAFTITNIELSLLQQDRTTGLSFRPIATLRATGADDPLSQPSYNLGPSAPEHGPIIFENVEVFPNLIDDLMREPTGLIFKVANFDVLDEFGRNLVYTLQKVNDRTVSLTIDFGDGTVEEYRVATASTFDSVTGKPNGITMRRALEICGIDKAPGDDTTLPEPENDPARVFHRNTYGTVVRTVGGKSIEDLTRIRGAQNDLTFTDPRTGPPEDPCDEGRTSDPCAGLATDQKKAWFVFSSNPDLDPDANFSDIVLHAQETVLLAFTRDSDGDWLFEREEYLYGSKDNPGNCDTDGDGLADFDEVRCGWTVARSPGQPYRAFPSPARPDSDLDGLEDDVERRLGTDPNRADTDEDALTDASEIGDTFTIFLFDGDVDPTNNPELTVKPYSDWVIIAGPDSTCDTTTAAGDDEVVVSPASGAAICVTSGANGVIDTEPANDDRKVATKRIAPGPNGRCDTTTADPNDVIEFSNPDSPPVKGSVGAVCVSAGNDDELQTEPLEDDFIRVVHEGLFATDPLNRDTDADGIPDGREVMWTHTNPNTDDAGSVIDSDGDGLFDDEEERGWVVTVIDAAGQSSSRLVNSDKFRADTDRDGLPDVYEWAIKTDPRKTDTDMDELFDAEEFDPADVRYDVYRMAEAIRRCEDAPMCEYFPPGEPPFGTDPTLVDTDDDGLTDGQEIRDEITIMVNGQPRQLPDLCPTCACTSYSDPTNRDTDSDGLTDFDERTKGTDPCSEDTDGDEVNDGRELHADVNTDPTTRDARVRFEIASVFAHDCDCNDYEEITGVWTVQLNAQPPLYLYIKVSNCSEYENQLVPGINTPQELVISDLNNDVVVASSTFTELDSCDSFCGGGNDPLTAHSEDWNYQDVTSPPDWADDYTYESYDWESDHCLSHLLKVRRIR